MSKRNLLIVLVALLAAAAAGYWAWERQQTAREHAAVLQLMAGASNVLQGDLPRTGNSAARSAALSAAAQQVDADAATLRAMSTARVLALSEAVAAYLDTARELAKRRATIAALEPRVRGGIEAFRAHMRNRGAADWTSEAARLKNRLEDDFREYQRTVDTHTHLSDGYAEEFESLAPLVPAGLVVPPETVAAVRDRVAAQGDVARAEMEALRGMMAPRS